MAVAQAQPQSRPTGLTRPTLTTSPTGLALATGLIAFVLYAATASRGIAWDDGGELAAGVTRLGVVHPDGYPAYVLGGWIFTHVIPVGAAAFKASLWSAFTAALAVAAVAYYIRERTGSTPGAVIASLILGTGGLFWNQATQPSVYPLFVLSIVLLLIAAHRWHDEPSPRRLAWLAAAAGLVAVSHRSGLVFLPFVATLIVARAGRSLTRPANLVALTAVLVPWLTALYIPLRQHASVFPNQLQAAHTTWWHLVTGPGLPYDQPFRADTHTVVTNVWHAILLIPAQLSVAAILLVPIGLTALRRDRVFLLAGLAPAIAVTAIVATTNGSYAFWHLPLLAVCAIAAGSAVPAIRLGGRALRPAGVAAIGAVAATGTITGIAYMSNHGADASRWAHDVLAQMPPAAHIDAPWSAYAPLKAMQELDHRRTDITVTLAHHWPTSKADVRRAPGFLVAMDAGPTPTPRGVDLRPIGPPGRVQRKGITEISFLGHRLGDVQYRARAYAVEPASPFAAR